MPPLPGEADAWRSAGGESYCENIDFPIRLTERWLEVLGKDGACTADEY
jgi:hypothetical protein